MRWLIALVACACGGAEESLRSELTASGEFAFTRVAGGGESIPGWTEPFEQFTEVAVQGSDVVFLGYGPRAVFGGIYRWRAGALERVADQNTVMPGDTLRFDRMWHPVLDGGSVVFHGTGSVWTARGYQHRGGVFRASGATLARLFDLPARVEGRSVGFGVAGFSASGGAVAFWGQELDSPYAQGLYVLRDGVLGRVVDGFSTLSVPALDTDALAFSAQRSWNTAGVYRAAGGTVTTLADTSTPIPGGSGNFLWFAWSHTGVRAGGGAVAFRGVGQNGQVGIYRYGAGGLERVVDTSTPIPGGVGNFTEFTGMLDASGSGSVDCLSVDGAGVAFVGSGAAGQVGLYALLGGKLVKVIDRSDLLDGKTWRDVVLRGQGLSGGRIAFAARFTDGSEGVFLAERRRCEPVRCDGWRNHGQYVSAVARAAQACVDGGLLTAAEHGARVSEAARSGCGR